MHCMGATELLSIFSQSIERTYELKLFSQWNEPKVPALLAFPTTFLAKQIFYGPPKMHCLKNHVFMLCNFTNFKFARKPDFYQTFDLKWNFVEVGA